MARFTLRWLIAVMSMSCQCWSAIQPDFSFLSYMVVLLSRSVCLCVLWWCLLFCFLLFINVINYYRVTTSLENLEMSENYTDVREMSGISLKVMEMSGNCHGKNLVMENCPKIDVESSGKSQGIVREFHIVWRVVTLDYLPRCLARRLCVCLCVRRASTACHVNLGGEGNALYPMLSGS